LTYLKRKRLAQLLDPSGTLLYTGRLYHWIFNFNSIFCPIH